VVQALREPATSALTPASVPTPALPRKGREKDSNA
jgi:hypothetical protein